MNKLYIFECENGKKYVATKGHCLSCKNCSDVFFDEDGPYALFCEKNCPKGSPCPTWEENETMKTIVEGE